MVEECKKPVLVALQWLMPEAHRDIDLPSYETSGSSGMDVCAAVETEISLFPLQRVLVPTGIAVAIPAGYEIQVRPRSGMAVKHGITIINAPGTIDSDYRGELKIGLINLGSKPYTIRRGDRVAQLVVCPVSRARFDVVALLDTTERGDGGFGHTGVK